MLRLYIPRNRASKAGVAIGGAELRHLRALRLERGDRLVVFDEHGAEHEVELETLGTREAHARIISTTRPLRESRLDLVLAPALLKAPRMDLLIEKATELGVHRIAPILTRHTVARGAPVERWRRIALSAAKQSARTVLPRIDAPVALAERLQEPWPGLRLLAWEEERDTTLDTLSPTTQAVVVVLGPEGGLTMEEVTLARHAGFTSVMLFPRVLRAETAALVAAAFCQRRWGLS